MFEEIAVWQRTGSKSVDRYIGFRDLETNRVWIALRNGVYVEEEHDLVADELFAPRATLEAFLEELPADKEAWKASISEAIAFYIELNPD